jgi:hypothetical protein
MIASFDIGEVNFAYCIGTADTLHKLRYANVVRKPRQTVLDACISVSEILSNEDFERCRKVIIEQQTKSNVRAQRLAQHVWTWFSLVHPRLTPEFVSAAIKTDRKLSYKQRKRFAVESVRKLLATRNDIAHLEYMDSLPKQDDVADAYIQLVEYAKRTQPVRTRKERHIARLNLNIQS